MYNYLQRRTWYVAQVNSYIEKELRMAQKVKASHSSW